MKTKKLLSLLLTLCMLLSVIPMMGIIASAASYDDGTYYYTFNNNGTASICPSDSITSTVLTIPDSVIYKGTTYYVTEIGDFGEATNVTSVTIPDTISGSISAYAFQCLPNLKTVVIGNGITEIKKGAFYECTGLTSVTIGTGIETIPNLCFGECTSLKSIVIPDNVTQFGENVFYGCTVLESVTLGNNVQHIESTDFSDTALYNNSNNWDNGIFYVGNYLIDADEDIQGTVNVKDGTKVIALRAFQYCSYITDIILPDSLIYINERAFFYCYNLTSLTIPASVKELGYYMLSYSGIDSMDDITFETDDINSVSFNMLSSTLPSLPTTQTGTATMKIVGYNNNVEVNGNVRNGQLLKPVITGYNGTNELYYKFGTDSSNTNKLMVSQTSDMDKAGDLLSCEYLCKGEGYAAVQQKAVPTKLTCSAYELVLTDGKLSFNLIATCEYDNPMCENAATTTTGDTEELQAEFDEKNVIIMHLGDSATSLTDILHKTGFIHLNCANVKFSSVSLAEGTSVTVAGTDKNALITPVKEGLSKISFECYTTGCMYHGTAGSKAAKLTGYRYIYVVDDIVSTSTENTITVTDNTTDSAESTYRIGLTNNGTTSEKQITFSNLQSETTYDVVQNIALTISGDKYTGSYHNYISTKAAEKISTDIADATYYASLSLNDNINLNFKVKDDDIDNSKLSVISGGVTYSVENGNMTATDDGVTMCIATKALAEMGEKVEIKVVYDSVDVKTYSISIADYCNYVAENGLTANEKAVASSLLKAGAYAQKLFNVDTDNLVTTVDSTTSADYSNVGEKIFNASSGITAVDASMSMTFSEGNSGAVDMVFTFTSLTLLSKSDFTVKNSKNEVLNNSSYTFDSSTNKLTIKNISSSRMAEQFTVTVNGASVTYGLYNYCKDVQGNANADLVNFANAIYAYGQAANTCYAK